MRKILASFLAAAMVASIGATMTFAATKVPGVSNTYKFDLSKVAAETATEETTDTTATATVELELRDANGGTITFTSEPIGVGDAGKDIVKAFAGKTGDAAETVTTAGGKTLKGTDFTIRASGSSITITTTAANSGSAYKWVPEYYTITVPAGAAADDGALQLTNKTVTKDMFEFAADADVDAEGSLAVALRDIVYCDASGEPVPLTESLTGIDKDQNDADGVNSNKTVYFLIKDGGRKYDDNTYWKLKLTKGDNGKYVSSLEDATKRFTSPLYRLDNKQPVDETVGRHRYIKVGLKELYTDDEYKITLDMRMTPKSKACDVYGISDDAELKVKDFFFYVKNMVKDADNDWKVGINGLMLNPLGNDWNNVTWYDEDGDVAHMKFFADSDSGKFYSKLSTKWEHEDYRSFFNNQDAYSFQFTGMPKISSTSRATLELYTPFVNEEGEETVDPETVVIYELIDGELVNVTDQFTYEEGDNGDMAFVTKTRFLGHYIICEHEVEGLDNGGSAAPDDVAPEDTAPAPVTPDGGSGAKTPPNTGRF